MREADGESRHDGTLTEEWAQPNTPSPPPPFHKQSRPRPPLISWKWVNSGLLWCAHTERRTPTTS